MFAAPAQDLAHGPSEADLELALDRFAAFAAHQLGEGVRIVTGWVEALEEDSGEQFNHEVEQALNAIAGGGLRLQRFVNDLLHLTALSREPPVPVVVEIGEPVAEALAELEPEIRACRAKIAFDDLHGEVLVDRRRAALLFEHLLREALAARRATPHVRLASSSEGGWLTVTVEDDGVAVTESQAQGMFTALAPPRGHGALLGAGVGPLICRRVVESHGGRIWATPLDEAGLRVQLTLPEPSGEGP